MNIYYVAGIPYSDELYHHGIKGQKWGIRRYQNPDGSLTPAGKAKYGTPENFNTQRQASKEKRSKNIKTALKVAGAVAAAGLVAYGAYKVSNLDSGTISKGKNKLYDGVSDETKKAVSELFDMSISEISDSEKAGRYARQRADDALEAMKSYNEILKKKRSYTTFEDFDI